MKKSVESWLDAPFDDFESHSKKFGLDFTNNARFFKQSKNCRSVTICIGLYKAFTCISIFFVFLTLIPALPFEMVIFGLQ